MAYDIDESYSCIVSKYVTVWSVSNIQIILKEYYDNYLTPYVLKAQHVYMNI